MSGSFRNRVGAHRTARRWSQEELARRSGLSRAAVSAIETDRVVPSTAAALMLARVFDCRVEDLFRLGDHGPRAEAAWAWPAPGDPCPFWHAEVAGRTWRYPTERTFASLLPADGSVRARGVEWRGHAEAARTLVLAGCDPAVGLLGAELAAAGIRLLPFIRSSRQALDLLGRGVVHVAGLHLQDASAPRGNEQVVRESLGDGYTLLRVSRWQEGLALTPGLGIRSVPRALTAKLRWVGREPGSGARRCFDSLFKSRQRPRGYDHIATDHLGVVETIRTGWAQAGICVRLPAAQAGLDFLVVREEDYDLCFRTDLEHDPRLQALVRTVRSQPFRRSLGELPGYESGSTGEIVHLNA